jgi:hypothetical protein
MHAVKKEKARKEPKAAKRGKKTPHHTRKKAHAPNQSSNNPSITGDAVHRTTETNCLPIEMLNAFLHCYSSDPRSSFP